MQQRRCSPSYPVLWDGAPGTVARPRVQLSGLLNATSPASGWVPKRKQRNLTLLVNKCAIIRLSSFDWKADRYQCK